MSTRQNKIFSKEYFDEIRKKMNHGDNANQDEINTILKELEPIKEKLRPKEKEEIFNLVDKHGISNHLIAPRWLCHFLGLRHKSVHILLKWESSKIGSVFILQVRSWNKSDSPGHLDISVGGHSSGTSKNDSIETAYRELHEELGISEVDLIGNKLIFKNEYENTNQREKDNFYNTEWREVFVGDIATVGFDKIQFTDDEVVGIYLCPKIACYELLNQKKLPIASALRKSLPYCI